jgi:23S rRNA (guanosine2251-2'-O)-methyltransferase
MTKIWIIGPHALDVALTTLPEQVVQIWIGDQKLSPWKARADKLGIPCLSMSKHKLTQQVDTESHQSCIAEVRVSPPCDLSEFFALYSDPKPLLILDQIFDPQNFGAILRSAECFGVQGVIWSKNRGCGVTPLVSKSSAGASLLVPLVRISNLAHAVDVLHQQGYVVAATSLSQKSVSLYSFDIPEKIAWIIGSEGEGVQPLLKKKADYEVMIPMCGTISSLNVAQATTALLSHFRYFHPI